MNGHLKARPITLDFYSYKCGMSMFKDVVQGFLDHTIYIGLDGFGKARFSVHLQADFNTSARLLRVSPFELEMGLG